MMEQSRKTNTSNTFMPGAGSSGGSSSSSSSSSSGSLGNSRSSPFGKSLASAMRSSGWKGWGQ
jgi:hypothetical protein